MLLGRQAECEQLDVLLAAARAGKSGALVLRGEAGIGKSALLEYAAANATGMGVLRARGVESESELPFSGLYDLFRPILGRLDAIPKPQAGALRRALALDPADAQPRETMLTAGSSEDRFTYCVATLSVLAAAAEESPLLVLVDDAQWLDASSREALLFAARRLETEGVLVLFATRDGLGAARPSGLPELVLTGLDSQAARELLGSRSMASPVAERLVNATAGNPLALLEIPSLLSEGQLSGAEPLEEPLPAGPSVERAFLRRLDALPDTAREALVVAAADERGDAEEVARAIESLGLDPGALGPAEAAGLVVISGSSVEFRHPLLRSAIYHGAPAAKRRAAHRALAEASSSAGNAAARRAWHLATATEDTDADVAQALEETALTSRRRGGYAAAASAFERAAALTAGTEDRARRLLEAADDSRLAGRSDHACVLLDEALGVTTDPLLRADIQRLRGSIEIWSGRPMAAHALLSAEAALVEEHDVARAAAMLADAVFPCFIAGDSRSGLAAAERATALAQQAGDSERMLASALHAAATILRGEASDARGLLLACAPLLDEGSSLSRTNQLVHFAGAMLVWIEEYEWARLLLGRAVEQARALSAPGVLPYGLAALSALDFRTGYWAASFADAAEAMRLANETGQPAALSYSLVCLARVEAAQGRETECREHVSGASELADRIEAGSVPMFTGSILGLLELGLGRPDEAIPLLEGVASLAEELGLGEPGVVQWAPDLIEAYVRAGRSNDAERTLGAFGQQAEHTRRTWALAASARCRGLLAPDEAFEEQFAAALALHEQTPTPFERARTELCLGERRRRTGRRADAREPLRSALQAFERLGASPWAERAAAELAASGETARRRDPSAAEQLTPQELQVALIVAQGATNREVGAALFLSPKTIETHLSRIYRKLGVRSRTELAALLAEERVPAVLS